MKNRSFRQHMLPTPWRVVERRFFDGRTPDIVAFSGRHGLNATEVAKLFSGEIISFSPQICTALHAEMKNIGKEMSKGFFRRLSNNWQPRLPPAASAALTRAASLL